MSPIRTPNLIAAADEGDNPQIILDPLCGLPGSIVQIYGINWRNSPPDRDLTLYWNESGSLLLGVIEALSSSTWQLPVIIPVDVEAGVHTIVAIRHQDTATADFTIPCPVATATPTPPADPSATPTPAVTPSPTPEATGTPPGQPLFYVAYAPVIAQNYTISEPNDSCEEAYPLNPNINYSLLADDLHDWYRVDLAGSGHLTVILTDFHPVAGQLAVYRGESCAARELLGHNGDFAETKIVDVGPQTDGRYYIYVSNDGAFNGVDPYRLLIQFP